MRVILCVVCAFALSGVFSACGATYHAGSVSGAPGTSPKGFAARALVIEDGDFSERWKRPEAPSVKLVTNARFGQKLYLVVIYSGAKGGPSGDCDVVFDVALRGPDGAIVERKNEQLACRGPRPQEDLLQLAPTQIEFHVDDGSPSGLYSFDGMVRDRIADSRVLIHQSFTIDDASRTTR